jgi:hypothetical protein
MGSNSDSGAKGNIVQPTYVLIDELKAEANVAGRAVLFIIVLIDSHGSGSGSE